MKEENSDQYKILQENSSPDIKQFLEIEESVFSSGSLSGSVKEMLGLIACLIKGMPAGVDYHFQNCWQKGVSVAEIREICAIAMVVEGKTVIPQLQRVEKMIQDKLDENTEKEKGNRSSVKIYTDGACKDNPGPGGYAALIIQEGKEKEITGFEPETTNNRMELRALIEGLKEISSGEKVKVYSDSNYLIQGVESWLESWKESGWETSSNKKVKNRDLWQKIDDLKSQYQLEMIKVKAHSGHEKNQLVDQLAKKAIEENI